MIAKSLTSNGYLIDGYPRQVEQGIMFEQDITPCKGVLYFEGNWYPNGWNRETLFQQDNAACCKRCNDSPVPNERRYFSVRRTLVRIRSRAQI